MYANQGTPVKTLNRSSCDEVAIFKLVTKKLLRRKGSAFVFVVEASGFPTTQPHTSSFYELRTVDRNLLLRALQVEAFSSIHSPSEL